MGFCNGVRVSTSPNHQALAEFVRTRRRARGQSQAAVQQAGGPSTAVVSKIENGSHDSISERTLAQLDLALGLQPGTSAAILEGEEPGADDVSRDDPAPDDMLAVLVEELRLLRDEIAALRHQTASIAPTERDPQ